MIGTLMICASLLAVDGDTIKCDGVNMRDMGDGAPFVSGYDTPEIGSTAKCAAEKALGKKAKARMAALLATPGVQVFASGETDGRYQRPLVWGPSMTRYRVKPLGFRNWRIGGSFSVVPPGSVGSGTNH